MNKQTKEIETENGNYPYGYRDGFKAGVKSERDKILKMIDKNPNFFINDDAQELFKQKIGEGK